MQLAFWTDGVSDPLADARLDAGAESRVKFLDDPRAELRSELRADPKLAFSISSSISYLRVKNCKFSVFQKIIAKCDKKALRLIPRVFFCEKVKSW